MTDWATLLQNNWQGWQNLPGITGYDVDYFDYSDNQDSGFPEIAGELEDCIGGSPTICSGQNIGSPRNSGKIYSYRMSGIAATRLDYCAHSMGGCVAKWYAENYGAFTHARINGFPAISWTGQFTCNRADNFGAGEFHRIITIGSPLNGSPLADSLVANAGYNGLQLAAGGAHLNGDLAAAEDLRQTSWVIRNCLQRGNPNAKFLPLVGTADNQPLAALTGSGFWQWVGAQLFTWPLAGGTADDWVVPVGSQIDAKGQAGGQGSKPVHNVVHTSEHGAWECGLWSAKALDRYFDWPAETFTLPSGRIEVYSAGCVMFNSNF
jgi:hypothetical protein